MVSFSHRDHVGGARFIEIRVLLDDDGHPAVGQHLERRPVGPLEHVGT